MSGACGSCTLCCTLMKVTMPEPLPVKPAREACQHCAKGGCAIYDDRPEPCRDWLCVWLVSQGMDDGRMASSLRPDRAGVVLEMDSKSYVIAHCQTPGAWMREPMRSWLIRMTERTKVLIEPTADVVLMLNPDGTTTAMEFVGVHPESNERRYRLEVK